MMGELMRRLGAIEGRLARMESMLGGGRGPRGGAWEGGPRPGPWQGGPPPGPWQGAARPGAGARGQWPARPELSPEMRAKLEQRMREFREKMRDAKPDERRKLAAKMREEIGGMMREARAKMPRDDDRKPEARERGDRERGDRPGPGPEMRQMMEERMREARAKMEEARGRFREMQSRIDELEAEVKRLKGEKRE